MFVKSKGFTVIELIMIILLAGILTTVIITDFMSSSKVSRLEAARFQLISDLIYAQSLAVTQQVHHGIVFTPSTTYSVYRQTTGNIVKDPLVLGDFTRNYAVDPNLSGVTLSASFGLPNTNQVEFDEFGIPYSDASTQLASDGTITLSYMGSTSVITVSKNTGRVY